MGLRLGRSTAAQYAVIRWAMGNALNVITSFSTSVTRRDMTQITCDWFTRTATTKSTIAKAEQEPEHCFVRRKVCLSRMRLAAHVRF
jgi:hypothetical protein